MKAKQHRLHYQRKNLSKTDPRRICHGSNNDGGLHCPNLSTLRVVLPRTIGSPGMVRVLTVCTWCQGRIEIYVPEHPWSNRTAWDLSQNLDWRSELYIIPELGLK